MKNRMLTFWGAAFLATFAGGCKTTHKITDAGNARSLPAFLKQGHRGTRGLMPENTIPAMEKGLQVGANTVEMDVHITRDGQVIVYHDASPDPSYTTFADGQEIQKADRKKYTWYQIDYAQARSFVIGQKSYPAFPQQQRLSSYAPLLGELIDSVDNYTQANHLPDAYYNVEIKSSPATDGVEQPAPEEMVRLVMAVLEPKHLGKRLFIQSFDVRPLQVMHRKYPGVLVGFLVDKKTTFEENMTELGFVPDFYNPSYMLVTPELLSKCHEKGMKVNPWTVEKPEQMEALKKMGVDGIITDYPNLLN